MAVAILDKIYEKKADGSGYEGREFSLDADTLYVKIKNEGGVADSYVSLSTILQNYVDFARKYDGLAVTTDTGVPPANKNVLIWVDGNEDTYDDGVIYFELAAEEDVDTSLGGN